MSALPPKADIYGALARRTKFTRKEIVVEDVIPSFAPLKGHARFGSEADIYSARRHVGLSPIATAKAEEWRFTAR